MYADRTTLRRRARATQLEIEPLKPRGASGPGLEGAVIAIDASGMKVTRRGDWIRKDWKVKKGWLKVHISVEVETKELLGMTVANQYFSFHASYPTFFSSLTHCA